MTTRRHEPNYSGRAHALMIILGVDPGSRFTGWGVVASGRQTQSSESVCLGHGVLSLGETGPLPQRLGKLLALFEEKIEQFQPDALAVEKVFMAKNADSAFKLGHARGVILAVAGAHNLPVYEYATRHVKKMLTGTGAAAKEQVKWVIERLFSLRSESLDATDALALAVCCTREVESAKIWSVSGASRSHGRNEVIK